MPGANSVQTPAAYPNFEHLEAEGRKEKERDFGS
jgi:hypothetical protein